MNALRAPEIGVPISHLQYTVLTSAVVIDRLISRHHHYLAWQICRHLRQVRVCRCFWGEKYFIVLLFSVPIAFSFTGLPPWCVRAEATSTSSATPSWPSCERSDLLCGKVCFLIAFLKKKVPGISYAEIASAAFKSGRPQLATRLLDFEPRAADQIPLLIW